MTRLLCVLRFALVLRTQIVFAVLSLNWETFLSPLVNSVNAFKLWTRSKARAARAEEDRAGRQLTAGGEGTRTARRSPFQNFVSSAKKFLTP